MKEVAKKEENSSDNSSSSYLASSEFKQLRLLYHNLKKKYNLNGDEIINSLEQTEVLIPCSIFNKKLSTLESISKYLKENLSYEFKDVAEIVNRSSKTIWQAYNFSKKKHPKLFIVHESKFYIPLSVLSNRKLSILENIVSYLKEHFELTFHDIGVLLQRDERTIWTVYNRSRSKGGGS